ncbi:MAG: T9SS type A sorting domain-containing protein [Bacteroidales bacterium]
MKKFSFFIVAFLLLKIATNAQITVTQSDMPSLNTTFTEVSDTVCVNINIGNAGTSQTWNLANIANSYQLTSSWVPPASRPGAAYFPTATVAVVKPGGQDSYAKISATSAEMLGMHGDFGAPIGVKAGIFSPSMKYFQYPTNYQTSFNGTYVFEIKTAYSQPPIDSMKLSFSINYTSIVDGWGNVTTPAFSNIASLRQKNTSFTTISSYAHSSITGWVSSGTPQKDTSINYIWLSNVQKFTLADVETEWSGHVVKATYLLSTGVVGIHENSSTKININLFPNPANEMINISGITQNAVLLIFDTNAKLISSKLLKTYNNTLNISDYSNGIYFYQIVDMNGQAIDKGKFSVVK